ncbi:MAG: MoaD/ThiS family protein [Dehalococcoidia bacterium]|nr:MoaD/ThiS family protein [Dehalococcoidia bacterium]
MSDAESRLDGSEVTVEVLTWVNRLVGGSGSGSVAFREALEPDDSVESLLRRFSQHHPALHAQLWERDGAITENLHVLVNHKMIGDTHTLRSRLAPGDTVSLLGQFSGG